ncbi:MAG: nucleoside phosphorylase [Sphingomonadaceae bacterium]
MPWELDDSEPRITPDGALSYYGRLLGGPEALALPDLLVATFQQQALQHMVDRLGAAPPTRWPTTVFWPLTRASLDGRTLALARIPIGAPAAASALELAIAAGVRTVLVVGSAGSLQPHLPVGSLAIPTAALRHEGTSHHYLPAGEPAVATSTLVDRLLSTALRRGVPAPAVGPVWTTDAIYRECAETVERHRAAGVLAVEMEAAALFAVASHRGAQVALIAAISDELWGSWKPGFHTLAYRRALLTAADIALETAAGIPIPFSA